MRLPANRRVGRICVAKSAKFLSCGAVDKISRDFKIRIFQTGSAPALRCKIQLRFHAHEPPLGAHKLNCRNLKEAPNFTLSRRGERIRRACCCTASSAPTKTMSAKDAAMSECARQAIRNLIQEMRKWRRRHTARDGIGGWTRRKRTAEVRR